MVANKLVPNSQHWFITTAAVFGLSDGISKIFKPYFSFQ
jgi:hypothetical protein